MTRRLDDAVLADVDHRLEAADAQLVTRYPGDDGRRQPVHTVYIPGNRYTATMPADWGSTALAAAKDAGAKKAPAKKAPAKKKAEAAE